MCPSMSTTSPVKADVILRIRPRLPPSGCPDLILTRTWESLAALRVAYLGTGVSAQRGWAQEAGTREPLFLTQNQNPKDSGTVDSGGTWMLCIPRTVYLFICMTVLSAHLCVCV